MAFVERVEAPGINSKDFHFIKMIVTLDTPRSSRNNSLNSSFFIDITIKNLKKGVVYYDTPYKEFLLLLYGLRGIRLLYL